MWVLKSNMEDLTSSETGVKPEVYMYHHDPHISRRVVPYKYFFFRDPQSMIVNTQPKETKLSLQHFMAVYKSYTCM